LYLRFHNDIPGKLVCDGIELPEVFYNCDLRNRHAVIFEDLERLKLMKVQESALLILKIGFEHVVVDVKIDSRNIREKHEQCV
jgi:hypothetical protein